MRMKEEPLPAACAWCGKVSDADRPAEWVEAEEDTRGSRFTHGICPECLLKLVRQSEVR